MKLCLCCLFLLVILFSCIKKQADVIVYNAKVYTVASSSFDKVEAFAVKDGKILAMGKTYQIRKEFEAKDEIDATDKTVYPGFIDTHAHFFGYGKSLQIADVRETKSWVEIIERLTAFAKTYPGGWLIGNDWDQNDWVDKAFPANEQLNEIFPNRPVFLNRMIAMQQLPIKKYWMKLELKANKHWQVEI